MAVMPAISIGGGLVPPIGAMLGTMGANQVMGAITSSGTPMDWSQYDMTKLSAIAEFNKNVVQPFVNTTNDVINMNLGAIRDEMVVHLINDASLRNPTALMRDVMMAIPEVNALALEGRIWGYGLSVPVLESYASGCRPYDLLVTDLGTPILPEGHGYHDTWDNTKEEYAYASETIIHGPVGEQFDSFTHQQLANIDHMVYQVREMLFDSLTDPTAPDNHRG